MLEFWKIFLIWKACSMYIPKFGTNWSAISPTKNVTYWTICMLYIAFKQIRAYQIFFFFENVLIFLKNYYHNWYLVIRGKNPLSSFGIPQKSVLFYVWLCSVEIWYLVCEIFSSSAIMTGIPTTASFEFIHLWMEKFSQKNFSPYFAFSKITE